MNMNSSHEPGFLAWHIQSTAAIIYDMFWETSAYDEFSRPTVTVSAWEFVPFLRYYVTTRMFRFCKFVADTCINQDKKKKNNTLWSQWDWNPCGVWNYMSRRRRWLGNLKKAQANTRDTQLATFHHLGLERPKITHNCGHCCAGSACMEYMK